MVGGNVGSGYVGGSGGSGGGGGVGAAWVDENYVSKAFFNQLFAAKGLETVYTSDDDGETWTQDGDPTEITFLPNEMPSEVIEDGETPGTKVKTVRSLRDTKSLLGLWTDQYLSALGRNSSSGGGGGAAALAELNDVALSNLQGGDVLKYDGTSHKWVNGAAPASGLTDVSLSMPTGFNAAKTVANNAISFNVTFSGSITKNYVLASPNEDAGAPSWRALVAADIPDLSGTYLKLTGGTITGQISGNIAGQWVAGRDHALLKQTGGTTAGWAPVVSMLTANGSWEMGTISAGANDDYLILSYVTNTDYNNSTNRTALIYFPKVDTGASGTLALTSDITSASNALQTWVGQQGFATQSWVGQQGFATQSWVGNNYLGLHATADAATKLTTVSKTAWGKTYWTANGVPDNVEGSISAGSNGGSIEQFHSIELNSAGSLSGYGGFIDFHYNGSAADYTSRIIEDALGRISFICDAGIRIGGAVLKWDSTNNALKLHNQTGENDTVNFYATGGISTLGKNSNEGGGGGVVGGQVASFTMQATGASYWHKIGTYVMNGEASVLTIDVFSGFGYNGFASQNSWARIMIKKSNSSSGISGAVGVTCEQFGPDVASQGGAEQVGDGMIRVAVRATSYNSGEVWVKTPWGYPQGSYTVQGNFGSWSHNSSTSSDTTNSPHNQNAVGYFDNTSAISYN